jgi:hypothetical protein
LEIQKKIYEIGYNMKKYDLVIGTGCSFMNGDAIYDKKMKGIGNLLHTPTKYLSDQFQCDYVNLAQSGSSNDHMFSRIIDYIENNDLINKKVFVLIGLSELARLYLKKGSDLHPHHLSNGSKVDYERNARKHFLGDVKGIESFVKFYMTHIFDNTFFEYKLGQQIILLKNYFENKGIDFIIFNALNGHLNLESILDEKNTFLFDNNEKIWYISLKETHEKEIGNFNDIEGRSPIPPHGRYFCNGHPSPGANKDLANLIYKKIVNNGWID